MATLNAAESAAIDAPAPAVYALLADYRHGHASILPPRYFPALCVVRGGLGAGTRIRFTMRLLGQTREVEADVEEPQPGRELVERILDERGTVTRFLVEPLGDARCRVTIATEWNARGAQAWIERLLAPPLLRRIYREQLRRVDEVARRSRAEA